MLAIKLLHQHHLYHSPAAMCAVTAACLNQALLSLSPDILSISELH